MDTINNIHLIIAVVCLLLGWTTGRALPEKLSASQKAPHSANSSAGGSLTPPRPNDLPSGLEQLLTRLRLRASGQTPADTSLLQPRQTLPNPLELLHIKASGQTPADTSLLPRSQESATSQSRRSGQGPAHVNLLTPSLASADTSVAQTPANVALLQAGKAPPRPASMAPQQDGVQREETSSFKEINGESVRVVVGNYGYQSPEGLPISFKYMSDENGNQASFAIGAGGATGGSGSRPAGPGGSKNAAGGTKAAAGPSGDADRKYLPPK